MCILRSIIFGFAFTLGFPTSDSQAQDMELIGLAEDVAAQPAQKEIIDEILRLDRIERSLRKLPLKMSEEDYELIEDIISEEIAEARTVVERELVSQLVQHFTKDELRVLLNLGESEVGASVLTKMFTYMFAVRYISQDQAKFLADDIVLRAKIETGR